MQTDIEVKDGRIFVKGPYSSTNNSHWRSLAGVFRDGRWVLADTRNSRAVVAELFGTRSGEVDVRVPAEGLDDGPIVQIGGYVLASRRGRDSRVEMPEGVSLLAGRFCGSCGSHRRPRVGLDDGMVFKLRCRRSFAEANGLEVIEPSEEKPPAIDI